MARMLRSSVRELERQFWVQIRTGLTTAEAAVAVGVSLTTAKGWFRKGGGMPPMSLVAPMPNRYLSLADRELIHAGIHAEKSLREIGRDLGRPASTIKRELELNLHHQSYRPRVSGGRRTTPWNYSPSVAHMRAQKRLARPKMAKLAANERLHDEVQTRLKAKKSPEQIQNRLRLDFPDDLEMRVSHETIYQSIYVQGRGALRRELAACLRTGRALRKPHRKPGERKNRITDMVLISERPAEETLAQYHHKQASPRNASSTRPIGAHKQSSQQRGLLHVLVIVGLGRHGDGLVHDGLVFDGRQSAEGVLAPAAVVSRLGSGHDRDTEFVAACPPLPVQVCSFAAARRTIPWRRCRRLRRLYPSTQPCVIAVGLIRICIR